MTQDTPPRFKIPRDWFYRMVEMAGHDRLRVELIDGEVFEMPPQKNWHALGVSLTQDVLTALFGPNFWVRAQASLDLSPYSVPDPDIAVVPGSIRQWIQEENPTTALLIVEVSDTTLAYDRGRKASLYAASGIADYWILNLEDRQLEVHRQPQPDASQHFGHGYGQRIVLGPTDRIAPLALPGSEVTVGDLLP
jgi:Uma2 family endonuclease